MDDSQILHFGVKGMRWGVRKTSTPGVSKSTDRAARKDAQEFSRAKMFYGDGAGTRRKLIKTQVESRSKKDPAYKKAFDNHLQAQDLGVHGAKARGERRRKDVVNSTAKTARGVKNFMMKNGAPVTLGAAVIGAAASSPKVRSVVSTAGRHAYSEIRKRVKG